MERKKKKKLGNNGIFNSEWKILLVKMGAKTVFYRKNR
jgi:hypothetical protein